MMLFSLSITAASFSVPQTESIVEGDTTTVCVTMKAIPENATLADEVAVSLSSMDGSGKDSGP